MQGDWIYWLGWAAFLAINIGMIYLLWWALFADRPRGRQRCPKCWYELTYSPSLTCPECGHVARSEDDLYRTRRRYGYAALALVVTATTVGAAYDRIYQRGLLHIAPTKLVILALPLADSDQSSVLAELSQRIRDDALSQREWAMFMRRCARGDWWARPTSNAWIAKYGVEIMRYRNGFAENRNFEESGGGGSGETRLHDLERILLEIPPRIELTTRETWPRDTPADALVTIMDWWPAGTSIRLRIEPEYDGASPVTFVRSGEAMRSTGASMPLGDLPEGRSTLVFTVHAERRIEGVDDDWQPAGSQRMTLDVNVEGALDDVIAARDEPRLLARMQEIFRGRVVIWDEGPSPLRFQYHPGGSHTALMENLGIGVDLRLMRDDELARHLRLWWRGGIAPGGTNRRAAMRERNLGHEIVYENPELLREIDPDDDRWRMLVQGNPAIALRAGDAESYWAGQFTLPVQVIHGGERAAEPDWRVERERATTDDRE